MFIYFLQCSEKIGIYFRCFNTVKLDTMVYLLKIYYKKVKKRKCTLFPKIQEAMLK